MNHNINANTLKVVKSCLMHKKFSAWKTWRTRLYVRERKTLWNCWCCVNVANVLRWIMSPGGKIFTFLSFITRIINNWDLYVTIRYYFVMFLLYGFFWFSWGHEKHISIIWLSSFMFLFVMLTTSVFYVTSIDVTWLYKFWVCHTILVFITVVQQIII